MSERTIRIKNYLFNRSDKLGSGSYSEVFLGTDVTDGNKVAIKEICLSKFKTNKKHLLDEVEIMKKLDHPNIVHLYDSCRVTDEYNVEYLYIVMELCRGGDLTSLGKPINEQRWRKYMNGIVSGLKYLRSKRISHRDLKPSNIFLTEDHVVKIADFTFARQAFNGDIMSTYCGTPLYMSPELAINHKCNDKSDIWSLGIIMYEYIYGITPYHKCKSHYEIIQMMTSGRIKFLSAFKICVDGKSSTVRLSKECVDLVYGLLRKRVNKRISWDELYDHPWLGGHRVKVKDLDRIHSVSTPKDFGAHHLIPRSSSLKREMVGSTTGRHISKRTTRRHSDRSDRLGPRPPYLSSQPSSYLSSQPSGRDSMGGLWNSSRCMSMSPVSPGGLGLLGLAFTDDQASVRSTSDNSTGWSRESQDIYSTDGCGDGMGKSIGVTDSNHIVRSKPLTINGSSVEIYDEYTSDSSSVNDIFSPSTSMPPVPPAPYTKPINIELKDFDEDIGKQDVDDIDKVDEHETGVDQNGPHPQASAFGPLMDKSGLIISEALRSFSKMLYPLDDC